MDNSMYNHNASTAHNTFNQATQDNIPNLHNQKKNKDPKSILILASLALLIASVGALAYLWLDERTENEDLNERIAELSANRNTNQQELAQEIFNALGKLIQLDEDEQVNIQEVTTQNIEAIRSQDPIFYADLSVGNYVVYIPQDQKVLIFDYAGNKLVNFSNYTIQPIPEDQIAETEKPLNIELRYVGSVSEEVKTNVKDAMTQLSQNYNIVSELDTASDDYEGLSVVLLNQEEKPNMSFNLLAQVRGTVLQELPEGEAEVSEGVDAVVIIGEVEQQVTGNQQEVVDNGTVEEIIEEPDAEEVTE